MPQAEVGTLVEPTIVQKAALWVACHHYEQLHMWLLEGHFI